MSSQLDEAEQRSPNDDGDVSLEQADGALLSDGKQQKRLRWQYVALTLLLHRLDVILGVVLVLAGVLKAHQLLMDPSAGRASEFPRELLIGVAAFELAFGCWLLTGLYGRVTRWLALAWFTSLAVVALAQALSGAASCACLGKLHTPPWLMLSFDVAAVAALWMWLPNEHSPRRHLPLVLCLCLCLLPATAFLGLASALRDRILFAEIDLGDIAQGGQKQQSFQCRNYSGAFLEVAAIETSCPCTSIRLERTGIPEGQFLKGNITLDLGREPEFVGNLAIEAKGLTQEGLVVVKLVIWAKVYTASKQRIDYDRGKRGGHGITGE